MLKTIIGKLERKKKKKKKKTRSLKGFNSSFFLFLLPTFKLKMLTQNPKTKLKRFWIGLDSETK